LQKACDIMLKNQSGNIPAGIVRNIGREGQNYELTTLAELRDKEVDMFSTVIIGNTQSEIINGRIVTPRGYKLA
jgi:precorrin-3B C17-methyltransferase